MVSYKLYLKKSIDGMILEEKCIEAAKKFGYSIKVDRNVSFRYKMGNVETQIDCNRFIGALIQLFYSPSYIRQYPTEISNIIIGKSPFMFKIKIDKLKELDCLSINLPKKDFNFKYRLRPYLNILSEHIPFR